jgi:hypothetical protein
VVAVSGILQRSAIAPWAGLVVAPFAWFAHHQLGSNLDYLDCRQVNPALYIALGVVFGALVAVSGGVSWVARTAPADSATRPETRRFAGYFGAGAAGMFLLAIILQTLGAVISPACAPQ